MAIVAQIVVESRRYSGWLDPRFPIGYWLASLSLTGDASSGLLGIDLLFQPANGPAQLNSQMYSVERFSIRSTTDAGRTVRIGATNMGGPSNQGFLHQYSVDLNAITGEGESVLGADMLTMLPLFLGSQRSPGITASFSLLASNIDLETYTFEAEGYRWGARSVLVDGGPQRPPTGPYGQ